MLLLVPLLAAGQAQLDMVDDEVRTSQNAISYSIEVAIPDEGGQISASTEIRYLTEGPDGSLVLDFDPVFTIDSIVASDGSRYDSSVEGGVLTVPHRGDAGDTLAVTVYYHGEPTDGLFIRENVHGRRTAFADNWPNRARHWFPSEDHPSDKARVSFVVEVPRGWSAVANGALAGVDTLPTGRTRWRWRTATDIPTYTMVIGAGEMTVTPIAGDVPQSLWTFAEDSAFAVNGPFRRAADIVRVFSDVIGPFPYAKLAHVESSTMFGGMENSSAIFYTENAYAGRTADEGLVAHETAHQWFGDAVTEYDWHHLWLSEGFATYFASLYFEFMGEEDTFRERMQDSRRRYLISPGADRPIIDPEITDLMRLLNINNYTKGAWVLHMLRAELGDSAFFRGIRDYYRTYRDSTALSVDLKRVMERAGGRSLETFFRQWLIQPGYPTLRVNQRREDDGRLAFDVRQTQPRSYGLYEVNLTLEVRGGGETRRLTIPVSGLVSTGSIEWTGPVDSVIADPDVVLLAEVRLP
jgi:aminopeptidase N